MIVMEDDPRDAQIARLTAERDDLARRLAEAEARLDCPICKHGPSCTEGYVCEGCWHERTARAETAEARCAALEAALRDLHDAAFASAMGPRNGGHAEWMEFGRTMSAARALAQPAPAPEEKSNG